MTGVRGSVLPGPHDLTGRKAYELNQQKKATVLNGHDISSSDPREGFFTLANIRKFPDHLVLARAQEIGRERVSDWNATDDDANEIIDYTL